MEETNRDWFKKCLDDFIERCEEAEQGKHPDHPVLTAVGQWLKENPTRTKPSRLTFVGPYCPDDYVIGALVAALFDNSFARETDPRLKEFNKVESVGSRARRRIEDFEGFKGALLKFPDPA